MSKGVKEKLLIALAVFAFLGLIFGYKHFFQTNETSSSVNSTNTFQVSDDGTSDSTVDSSGEYESNITGRSSSVYACSSDCSGHEAGYRWAEENSVCDPYFDGGNSESFAEGVRAFGEVYCPDDVTYEEN